MIRFQVLQFWHSPSRRDYSWEVCDIITDTSFRWVELNWLIMNCDLESSVKRLYWISLILLTMRFPSSSVLAKRELLFVVFLVLLIGEIVCEPLPTSWVDKAASKKLSCSFWILKVELSFAVESAYESRRWLRKPLSTVLSRRRF